MALTPATVHLDKKCGASGIADNKKCNVGQGGAPAGKKKHEPNFVERLRSGYAGLQAGVSAINAGMNAGLAIQHRSLGHGIAALGSAGGAALHAKASSSYLKGKTGKGLAYTLAGTGTEAGGMALGNAVATSDFRKRQANQFVGKEYKGSDPYKDLGLSKNASVSEARAAYLRVAQKHHPDKGGDPEKFRKAKEAYAEIQRRNKGRRDSVWAYGFAA